MGNKKPNCEQCEMPRALPANTIIMDMLNNYPGLFVNGDDGINANGISLVLEAENIPGDLKSAITQKLLVFIRSALKIKSSEGQPNG